MRKCFICGREYDETNREPAVVAFINGEKKNISCIEKKDKRTTLALCKYCVKAAVVGVSLLNTSHLEIDEPLVYENGDVEDIISN